MEKMVSIGVFMKVVSTVSSPFFPLLVGIWPVLFSRRSPLRLQEYDRQYAQQSNKIRTSSND